MKHWKFWDFGSIFLVLLVVETPLIDFPTFYISYGETDQ